MSMSILLVGTVTTTDFSLGFISNFSFLNTSFISSFEIFVPNTSFINLYSISISFSLLLVTSYLSIPLQTFAPAYFSSKLQALSIAIYVLAGSKPFSNLLLASLLKILFDVFLTFTESNIADSIITFLVVASTSVFNPPITPARPTAFVPSVITISSLVKVLSWLSNVVNFSPSSAILTTILFPRLSAS